MSVAQVVWDDRDLRYCGCNGYGHCRGLDLVRFEEKTFLNPITSKGYATDNCKIEIPTSSIPDVIAALQTILEDLNADVPREASVPVIFRPSGFRGFDL